MNFSGTKKKVAILANCQGKALSQILKKIPEFNKKFEIIPIDPIHLLKEENAENIFRIISSLDFLIHQPIGLNYGKYASKNILKLMKNGASSISFPVIYFSGYNPETIYLKNNEGKTLTELGYNDLNKINLFIYESKVYSQKSMHIRLSIDKSKNFRIDG